MSDPYESSRRGDNLSAFAYRAVLELIMTHEIRSGEPIVESRLAAELGISRTPLREALQRLDGEGVLVRGDRSFSVRVVDLSSFSQAMEVREMLEGEATLLAVKTGIPLDKIAAIRKELDEKWTAEQNAKTLWRLDNSFHNLILDHCENGAMVTAVRQLRNLVRLYSQPYLRRRIADRIVQSKTEHTRILDALEAGHPKDARKAMIAHIRSVARDKLGRFS